MTTKNEKMWGGRFAQKTSALMEKFSASVHFDKRLYSYDIQGSIAHANMLHHIGVLSSKELMEITHGLTEIKKSIEADEFDWNHKLEDVHMNIEHALTQKIGAAGKKLHTARSRNDQIATDIRLYLRESVDKIAQQITDFQNILATRALDEADTILPGFTHLQVAQPVTFGHHLLAWNAMLDRDYDRLLECRVRIDICPLGSAALAGTSFAIDRDLVAQELNFKQISNNSLDAVSDRDFAIEFNAAAALIMSHLSRISEELIIWSSEAYQFVDLGDEFCTGSSIMPQKKNSDAAELTRGKSARVTGNLIALLTLMKGQPLAYNRDNQEDKEPIFDTVDTLTLCLDIFPRMIEEMKINRKKMRSSAERGYSTATDIADYLVRKNIPFRQAHEIVGKAVALAYEKKINLDQIDLNTFQQLCPLFEKDLYEVLSVEGSVRSRNHTGGTAPAQVKIEALKVKKKIEARSVFKPLLPLSG